MDTKIIINRQSIPFHQYQRAEDNQEEPFIWHNGSDVVVEKDNPHQISPESLFIIELTLRFGVLAV